MPIINLINAGNTIDSNSNNNIDTAILPLIIVSNNNSNNNSNNIDNNIDNNSNSNNKSLRISPEYWSKFVFTLVCLAASSMPVVSVVVSVVVVVIDVAVVVQP